MTAPDSVTRGAGTAEAVEESFAHDLERQLTGRTDGRGNTWATVFDGYGRLAERRDPLGNRTTTEYDDQGNPTRVESFDGATGESLAETAFEHDLLARRTTTTERLWRYGSPDTRDLVSETTYDPVGHATAMRDPLGRVTAYRFDAAERLVEITDPAGNRTLYELDPAGNPTATTDVEQVPAGAPVPVTTTATYDAAGRLATMTDPLGNVHRRRYDARDNLRFAIDPESFVTESRYDGLDRRIATLQPEGVDLAYTFDLASRLTEYRDALGHTTRYAHDALDRQTSVTFPDATTRVVSYDRSHNAAQIEDANGTVIAQTHDAANRLTSRQVTPAEGVAGATAESYAWDGLDRLVRAQKGDAVTELDYDSLSRRIREATDGREVTSEHDDADNPVATAYPVAADVIGRVIDPLDRPERIGPRQADGTVTEAASYGFRGRDLVARHAYGNGLTGTRTFDAARRPLVDSKTLAGSPVPVFEESLAWSPRSLKVAQSRGDLNGTGYALAHDGLQRLLEAARPPEPTATVPNNTAPAPAAIAALPDRFGYQYDRAQNLTARRTVDEGIGQETALPPDASGRNRPASIDGVPLAYDANGNLVQKGDLRIEYDFRNLPVRVSDSTGEIARYTYDAFNRRIARHVGGQLHETVWSGWQEIEHMVDGQLVSRNLYGLGLDEIVRIDRDTDGDGVLDQELTPLYDHTGNLAVVTDEAGRPLERYTFSPYGERTVTVDLTPPRVVQVRVTGGEVWIEASEAVRLDAVVAALGEGSLALTDTSTGEPIAVTATQPVRTGRMQHRRVVLTPAVAPAEGTPVTLSIEPAGWVDLFSNELAAPFEESFAWPASDAVVFDAAVPELVQVAVKDGVLEVQLTEEIDPATFGAGLRLDGEAVAWTTAADRYTLRADEAVEGGPHTLELTSALADLAGAALALASERSFDFTVPAADPNLFVFRVGEPGEVSSSTVGNRFGFHGRPVDPETGWVFFRNRYLDPELGRFLQVDPMGYIDGPSSYAYGLNNPINYSDPLGLACTTEHGGTNQLCNPMDEMELSSDTPWWEYAWAVAAETGGNTLTEGLFLNVFADAPHVVMDPDASGGEKALAGGKATGAAVLNLGGAGVVVKAGLGRLAATRPVQWAAQRLSGSRFGQRVTGVLMEDVGVLWRRGFSKASTVVRRSRKYRTTPMDHHYRCEELGKVSIFKGRRVPYLTERERLQYLLRIEKGRLYDAQGQLFDTGEGAALYVMDRRGRVFARQFRLTDDFHHSSFLAGEPVAGAGMMRVEQGRLVLINDRSGHYRPPEALFQQFIDRMRELGVDIPTRRGGR